MILELAEQREIVCQVKSLFMQADQLEARYAKAKTYVEKLTPSLLAPRLPRRTRPSRSKR